MTSHSVIPNETNIIINAYEKREKERKESYSWKRGEREEKRKRREKQAKFAFRNRFPHLLTTTNVDIRHFLFDMVQDSTCTAVASRRYRSAV